MKIGIICDNASALLISKWIADKYQNNNPNKPATLRRDMIFLFFILKYPMPPIVSPAISRIGKQNKYLNISTIAKETSLEKYFIIATIEVPTTISRNRNSAPRKYESLEDTASLLKFYHAHSSEVIPLKAQPSNSYFSLSTNLSFGNALNNFGKATKLIIVLAIDAPAQ